MTAGDIHVGGFADVQLESGGLLLNQIVASAVANLPEASITALNLVGAPIVSASTFVHYFGSTSVVLCVSCT